MKFALRGLSVALIAFCSSLDAQQPIGRTTTAGVLIDVSVLGRDGRPVLDLGLDDFELSEGGTRQRIVSASLVQGDVVRPIRSAAGTVGAGTPPAPGEQGASQPSPDAPLFTASVTAILFDRLSTETRLFARKAALALVATMTAQHDYGGVFLADTRLIPFVPFTNQHSQLRDAINAGTAVVTGQPASGQSAATSRTRDVPVDPNQGGPTAGAEMGGGWISALEREKLLNAAPPEGILRRIELRMSEGYQQFVAEYEGQSSIAGLRAVVEAISSLPGRKSIMYFAESLPMTDRLKPKFDAVIVLANRHNVTIYAVDAAGLRVHSTEAQVNRNLDVAGSQSVGDAKREEGAWTKELERQSQMLASSGTAVLGRLAKETGGFLLQNTNDLAAGVVRMQQERSTYYLLAYQPVHATLDGKFRRVEVKVKRPRVTVRARPGYTAVGPQ